MKTILITLIFSTLFLSSSAQQGWFRIKENPKSNWKNPGSTAVMSFFLPGSGYFANDMIKEGFVTFGAEVALVSIGMYYYTKPVPNITGNLPYYPFYYNDADTKTVIRNRNIAYTFFAFAGAIHLFQFAHSTILTNKSNRINGFASNKRPFELFLTTRGDGLALNLSF